MKVCVLAKQARYEKFRPDTAFARSCDMVCFPMETPTETVLVGASDAEILFADAIATVDAALIAGMPKLRLIHSEGVAYNRIDCAAAAARGIPVCNNKGANAGAVAEQAVLLMLSLLRTLIPGDAAVRSGQQIQRKEFLMLHGIPELSEQTVGLVGFGDIGQETAKRLAPFGCKVVYTCRKRKSQAVENDCKAQYLPLNDLLRQCTMVSLHLPVTPESTGMVNDSFLAAMQPGSWLINTARGELVDNGALERALRSGHLAGAGLDTLAPEPVPADHPLLQLPEDCAQRLVFSPHAAGVTTGMFCRAHQTMWRNAERSAAGERPSNIVNGL